MDEPGRDIRIAERGETERRAEQIERFVREVLGLAWALVTDESTLRDFESVIDDATLERRVLAAYGVPLPPGRRGVPLYRLTDELEAARRRGPLN